LNLAPAAFLVMALAGIVCGLSTSLRISRARRELMLLADQFEATPSREEVP
jgi:HAMP domain-containing protein